MNRAQQGIARKVLPFPGVTVINPGPEGADMPEAKVFTPVFLVRLAAITAAEREIRAMGYSVAWTALAGQLPEICVTRSNKTMAPLLDRLENKRFQEKEGKTVVSGRFMDCCVFWTED